MYYMNFVKYNASLSNILKNLIFPLHLSSLGGGVKWIKQDQKKKKKNVLCEFCKI